MRCRHSSIRREFVPDRPTYLTHPTHLTYLTYREDTPPTLRGGIACKTRISRGTPLDFLMRRQGPMAHRYLSALAIVGLVTVAAPACAQTYGYGYGRYPDRN